MPAITRKGDKNTGHDGCAPVEAVEGAGNFLVNGRPIVLVGDKYASHGCLVHSSHQGQLSGGSPSFFVNGRAVGRVGDPISCGGTVAEGSSNFIVGNGNANKLNQARCERNEAATRHTRKRDDDIFFCLPLIADAMGNKANEKDRIGWHYLRDMFYKWLAGDANDVPQNNPNPFWVDIDWVLSYPLIYDWENDFPEWVIKKEATDQLSVILAREGYLTKQDCEFDFINSDWTEWEKFYYQRFDVEYKDTGALTGLFACLGKFSIRFLPKGKIKYLGENQYEITIEQVAGFVYDTFNFAEDDNWLGLGYWSCEKKEMNLFLGEFMDSYVSMSNKKFNNFREYNQIGNDFLVLSRSKLIDNFEIFSYHCFYE